MRRQKARAGNCDDELETNPWLPVTNNPIMTLLLKRNH